MHVCNRCGIPKDESEFGKDARLSKGIRKICKTCCNGYQKTVAKLKRQEAQLKHHYGIDNAQWERMWSEQKGLCAANPTHVLVRGRTTHVDHCHKTGEVRGLLCEHCNRALGGARDDIETLTLLIEYLKRTSTTAKALRAA